MKKIPAILIILAMLANLFGCEQSSPDIGEDTTASASESVPTQSSGDMFTDRDSRTDYDEGDAVKIELSGSSASASSNSVKISGSTVTITEEAVYVISGTLDDGMLIVDAPDTAKLQIVLNSVSITSKTSAALYIKEADKVFVTLVGESSLSSGDGYSAIDDSNIDAAVFSKQDLTLNGDGTLSVSSPAGHGIVSKDDLVFTGGTYYISAASHAIDANDSVRIKSASITADAGKDGIHAENNDDASKGFVYFESGSLTIECEGDGISSGAYMQLEGGTINILAGGGYENGTSQSSSGWGGFGGGGGRPGGRSSGNSYTSAVTASDGDGSTSMKGLKSGGSMLINSGSITVDSADDAIHSNASATINGGTFALASGDDAIHAEDTLTVTAGNIIISESYEGLEALHIDVSGGNITLKASDDGLNAAGGTDSSGTTGGRDGMFGGGNGGFGGMSGSSNGTIVISAGTVEINASGDGIDANGTLEISGGFVTVCGPISGDTAVLDYDRTGIITGGTFVGTGSSMMAQSLDGEGQGVIGVSVGSNSAGTKITVSDKNGKELLSYEPEQPFQIFIFSSPEIKSGETYKISVGSQSGEIEAS